MKEGVGIIFFVQSYSQSTYIDHGGVHFFPVFLSAVRAVAAEGVGRNSGRSSTSAPSSSASCPCCSFRSLRSRSSYADASLFLSRDWYQPLHIRMYVSMEHTSLPAAVAFMLASTTLPRAECALSSSKRTPLPIHTGGLRKNWCHLTVNHSQPHLVGPDSLLQGASGAMTLSLSLSLPAKAGVYIYRHDLTGSHAINETSS